jgi:hypothetical protein
MNLEDFVTETLMQIINGVREAQEFAQTKNACINPVSARMTSSQQVQHYDINTGVPLQNIEFDVGITVTETSTKQDGALTTIGSVTVSPQNPSESQNSSISRIRFSVPILLPLSGRVND